MLIILAVTAVLAQTAPPTGAAVFENSCATCHAGNDPRTPTEAVLKQKTPQSILDALTTGVMRPQGSDLSDADKKAVDEFLGTAPPNAAPPSTAGVCTTTAPFDPSKGAQWNGWGVDVSNQRYQPAEQAGMTSDQVSKLKLKWAFGFPNATSARALPTVVGGRVFVGSTNGTVYSLDASAGCIIWTFQAKGGVRAGIVIGPRSGSPGKYVAYL